MHSVQAINAGDITKIGIGVIVVVVVIGILLGLLIKAILGRIIIAVVVVVLAVFVWQQRGHVKDEFNSRVCHLNATFLGIHLDAPDDVRKKCEING